MARRVVSLLQGVAGALLATEPALEANAYAVAEDVDLTLVLRGPAVELAVAGGETRPGQLAGVGLPPAASAQDLRGLIESGVAVLVTGAELDRLGLAPDDLVPGVALCDDGDLAEALRTADAVIDW
ncbi:MAG TPA: DsrE family protein [Egibacteraceae bacterium]|nr:DsrE family protein [Egibacteraceae bacterium]